MKRSSLQPRKRNGLKIAFLTIVSLRKHKSELGIILHDNNIDIIGLSETLLDSKVNDSEVSIHGYRIFRNDRNSNVGGVAVYVRENLPEPIIKIKSDILEPISLEVSQNIHAKVLHLMCWYGPPTAGVDEFAFENLREILKGLDREKIGNTNCDLNCSNNANAKQLKSIYSEYQLLQLINCYTRELLLRRQNEESKEQVIH